MKHSTFASSDKLSTSHFIYWDQVDNPVATLQIVHGMAEHVERYSNFADYLNSLGIIVVGHDHLGHGESLSSSNYKKGFISFSNPMENILDDIDKMNQWINQEYSNLPHFIMGHSMGSFSVRTYLQKYKSKFTGVILMGTGQRPKVIKPILEISGFLNKITPTRTNKLMDFIAFSGYSKKFNEESRFNWLSKNQQNVQNYENDPNTGFIFTNNGFFTLFQLISQATQTDWCEDIDVSLPFLIVSGSEDPVGDYGQGPLTVKKELLEHGSSDVSLVLFEKLRHEILFEGNKNEVYRVISDWIINNI